MALNEKALTYFQENLRQVPAGENVNFGVSDIAAVAPPMNDYQRQIYDQMDRYNKAIPVQDKSTYFPSASENINKGSYSGSIIGSVPIYAPSRLTPFGVFDAKQQALKEAAAAKAKELDDFTKMFGKAPETTRRSVQDELDEGYYSWLAQWTEIGKKRYGKDFARYLKNDTQFLKEQQSWYTVAKYNDQLVEETARIQADVKTGNFIASPELIESMNYVMAGYDGLQQPGNQQAADLSNNVLRMQTYYDLDKAVNESLDKLIQDVYETNPGVSSQGIYDLITTTTTTSTDDSKLRELAKQLKATRYAAADNITEDMIFNNMRAKLGTKIERNVQKQTNQFSNAGAGDIVFDETAVSNETEPVVFDSEQFDENGNPVPSSVNTYDGQTLAKPQKLNVPTSSNAIDPATGKPIQVAGNTQVEIGKTFNVLVDKQGRIVDESRAATALLEGAEYKTFASATYKTTEPGKNPWDQQETVTKTVWMPANEIQAALMTTNPDGTYKKGVRLDIQNQKAQERNQQMKQKQQSKPASPAPKPAEKKMTSQQTQKVVKTQAEVDALPSGTIFIWGGEDDQKGQTFTKD